MSILDKTKFEDDRDPAHIHTSFHHSYDDLFEAVEILTEALDSVDKSSVDPVSQVTASEAICKVWGERHINEVTSE